MEKARPHSRHAARLTFLALALSPAYLGAAVIGHWRFEGETNDEFRTDSINGGILGQSGTPVQTSIPMSGPGSAFPNPIPSSGATNTSFATFSGSNHFAAADHSSYDVGTQMTIEFFFNATTIGSTGRTIASQFDTGAQRSWLVSVRDDELRFNTSSTGESPIAQNSTFGTGILTAGNDYYGAAVYNAGTVTFYLQNLTTPGPLLSSTVTGYSATLHNSTTSFRIGAYNSSGSDRFTGGIDEVRWSDTALSASELMIVPEPGSLALALAGLALFSRRRR